LHLTSLHNCPEAFGPDPIQGHKTNKATTEFIEAIIDCSALSITDGFQS